MHEQRAQASHEFVDTHCSKETLRSSTALQEKLELGIQVRALSSLQSTTERIDQTVSPPSDEPSRPDQGRSRAVLWHMHA